MKKVIILSLALVSVLSVDAQRKRTRTATSQGNVVVRTGLGINHVKVDPDLDPVYKSTTIDFNPSVGFMAIDNLELGLDFGISNTTSEDVFTQSPVISKTNTKATDVNFGVYVQKYFPLNNWFAFTTQANLGLSTGTYNTDNVLGSITSPDKMNSGNRNGVGGSVSFGFAFTPYNAFSLFAHIASLGVNNMKNDPDGVNDITNTTNVGFNVIGNTNANQNVTTPLTFGCAWYFGRGLWKK